MPTVLCCITALLGFVVSSRFVHHLLLLDRVDMAVVGLDSLEVNTVGLDVVGNTSAVLVVQDIAVVVVAGMKQLQFLQLPVELLRHHHEPDAPKLLLRHNNNKTRRLQ